MPFLSGRYLMFWLINTPVACLSLFPDLFGMKHMDLKAKVQKPVWK